MKNKTLAIFVIVLSILVILFAAIDIYQIIKVGELKASIVKKDQVIDAAMEVIIGKKADIIKLEDDKVAMANQSQQDREIIKSLRHSIDEILTIATRMVNRWFKVINFCDDETIVADTDQEMNLLKKIIMRAE